MPILTRLEPQKKDRERVNLYIDDEFFCGASLDTVVALRLYKGKEINVFELDNIKKQSGEQDLYLKTINYIMSGLRTRREIAGYLRKKNAEQELVDNIIMRLEKGGLINDTSYANMFTSQKSAKMGKAAIKNKLYQKGVSSDVIEQALLEVSDDDQAELVESVADKYMRAKEPTRENFNKLYRYLAAKGFDFDLVAETVNKRRGGYEDRD